MCGSKTKRVVKVRDPDLEVIRQQVVADGHGRMLGLRDTVTHYHLKGRKGKRGQKGKQRKNRDVEQEPR